jgi:hypothetical protein
MGPCIILFIYDTDASETGGIGARLLAPVRGLFGRSDDELAADDTFYGIQGGLDGVWSRVLLPPRFGAFLSHAQL